MSPSKPAAAKRRAGKLDSASVLLIHAELDALLQTDLNPSFSTRRAWVAGYCDKYRLDDGWGAVIMSWITIRASTQNRTPMNLTVAEQVLNTMNQSPGTNSVTQTAGRDQIGATAGSGNMVEIGDITSFNNWVDHNSGEVHSDLRHALKGARAELETAVKDQDERQAVLAEFQKLAQEAVKKDNKPTVLKMAWGAITSVVTAAKSLPSLLKVGELLHLIPKSVSQP